MLKKTVFLVIAGLFLLPAAGTFATESDGAEPFSARIKARPGTRTSIFRVPGGKELLLTQACVPHPGMSVEVGRRGSVLTYIGHGCTDFSPGVSIRGGEHLYCGNRSGVDRDCMVVGMLRDDPKRGRGAQFQDVDEAIKKNR